MVETVYLDEATAPDGTDINLVAGNAATDEDSGENVTLQAGTGGAVQGDGGSIFITSGAAPLNGSGGSITLQLGAAQDTGNGGTISVFAGPGGPTSGNGGSLIYFAGAARGGNGNGGDITFTPGAKDGSGIAGHFLISGLEDFADDAEAATGGVPVDGLYRTASALKVRVA